MAENSVESVESVVAGQERPVSESVVCPVCGGRMSLSRGPVGLMDSADRWGECASCGSEALVDWVLGGRRVVVSYDGSGRGLSELQRMVRDLEAESELSSWVPVPASEAFVSEFASWPVVASPAGASCVLVGSVYREGGAIVAENITGDRLGCLILWESWEEVEEWVSGCCPDCSAGFPVGSWIGRPVGRRVGRSGVVMV